MVGRVGVGEETMGDKDVTSFRFNLGEIMARLDVVVKPFEWRIETFRMVVQDVTDP